MLLKLNKPVCVCDREREGGKEREREGGREREKERERKRVRERERVCVYKDKDLSKRLYAIVYNYTSECIVNVLQSITEAIPQVASTSLHISSSIPI